VNNVERIVAEPVFLQTAHFEILDENIAFLSEEPDNFAPFLALDVNRHRFFVAVRAKEIGGLRSLFPSGIAQVWRPPAASLVTFKRTLNLDDFCAKIAERLPCPWPGEHSGHVKNADTFKTGRCNRHLCDLLKPKKASSIAF